MKVRLAPRERAALPARVTAAPIAETC